MNPVEKERFMKVYPDPASSYDEKIALLIAQQLYLGDLIIECERKIKAIDLKIKRIKKKNESK
jgi:hypothetical protein